MDEKLPFEEGSFINKPPLFCGLNYQFWKVRMNFLLSQLMEESMILSAKGHTVITESKDLIALTIASLFRKFKEHELEMNQLNGQESEENHVKSISLNVTTQKIDLDSSDCSDSETPNDGDQAQVDMEANQQDQEEVEAQMEDGHGGQSPPQRLTRSMFKALGARGQLFSLFVISLVEGA